MERKSHMYAFELCAAISDDFRNSPEMVAHDLDTYIFTFTKIGMLSPHFSEMRPAFLKLFLLWESFDIGLIRVGASPEFTTVTSTMSRLNFCTYITHCVRVIKALENFPILILLHILILVWSKSGILIPISIMILIPNLILIPILSHSFTISYDFKSPLVECANKLAQILLGLSNLTGGDGKMMMQHSSRAVGTNRDVEV